MNAMRSIVVGLVCLSAAAAEAKNSYSVPEDGTIAEVIAAANADPEAKKVVLGADVYQLAATLEITGAYRVEGSTGDPSEVTIKPASKVVLQPVVKVSNSGATDAELAAKAEEGVSQLHRYAADPTVPALAKNMRLHLLLYQFKGAELVRLKEIPR